MESLMRNDGATASGPSRKAAVAIERRIITPLLGVVVGALLYTSFGVMRSLQTMDEVKQTPFKAFPDTVSGTTVRWARNTAVRARVAAIQPEMVTQIELQGGGASGIPTGRPLCITDRTLVRLYVDGLKSALLPATAVPTMPTTASLPPDIITLRTSEQSIRIDFHADVLPEMRSTGADAGTFSPEFQFALRRTGIPAEKQGMLEQWVLRTRIGSNTYQARKN